LLFRNRKLHVSAVLLVLFYMDDGP